MHASRTDSQLPLPEAALAQDELSNGGTGHVEPAERARPLDLIRSHVRFVVAVLAVATLSRLGLVAWQFDRIEAFGDLWSILVGGWRMDLVIACYAVAPALLVALLFARAPFIGRPVALAQRLYFAVLLTTFVFFEIATPSFIAEYDSRPNRLFVEYLVSPVEVSTMLWNGYRLEVLLATVLTTVVFVIALRFFREPVRSPSDRGPVREVALRVALFLVAGPIVFLGARSSLQHRPANPSSVVFSSDHLLNELCLSSMYSVAFAVSQMRHEADASDVYGSIADTESIFGAVREHMATVDPSDFVPGDVPTLHEQRATRAVERPLNLVVILEESLGAQYVEELGGEPITSFIGTLSGESWWFDRMYATGTRSVRGIEATVSGFPPTPARSVVKLGLSQSGFFTIAGYLSERGYHTRFVYGGESHFDNMKRFFSGNGFEEIVDQDDFEVPHFIGSWGVCDDDIFDKTHELLMTGRDEPTFTLVFSVSNHSPWEYPIDDFQPVGDEPATVENAVRYADHALGTFVERARRSPYWDDTVFLVVADHDARVHGASLVPVQHFHIPAAIFGGGVEPRRDARITSQLDLPPTLLSLIGASGRHPMIGRDLTALAPDAEGRAIMQYGPNQAYMQGERVVIHQPRLPAEHFTWDGAALQPAEPDAELERVALAHALFPSIVYRERLYRSRTHGEEEVRARHLLLPMAAVAH